VAVHCHGDQAAHDAMSRVDSIEHGLLETETLTDDEKKGNISTPTLMATEWIMNKIDNYPQALPGQSQISSSGALELFRTH